MTCLRWRKCPTGIITGGRFMNRTHLNKSREKNKWTKSSSLKMFKANVHIHLVPECCRNNTELTLYCCMFNLHWTVSRNGFRNVPFLFFSAPFRGNHSSLGLLVAPSSYFGAKAEHGRRAHGFPATGQSSAVSSRWNSVLSNIRGLVVGGPNISGLRKS